MLFYEAPVVRFPPGAELAQAKRVAEAVDDLFAEHAGRPADELYPMLHHTLESQLDPATTRELATVIADGKRPVLCHENRRCTPV